jgi:single-strand DNA-binding protein
LVEGRLQTRSWEDQKSGQKRYSTEIIAQTVQFIGGGSQAVRGQAQAALGAQAGSTPNAGGAYAYGAGSQGYGGGGGGGAPAPTAGGSSYSGVARSGADSGRRFDSDPGDLGGDPGEYGGGTPPAGLEDIPF